MWALFIFLFDRKWWGSVGATGVRWALETSAAGRRGTTGRSAHAPLSQFADALDGADEFVAVG
jgi:hypothetical protein